MKKHPHSIFFHGCPAETVLAGVMDQCAGMRLRVHAEQPKSGARHLDIQGPFTLLDAGAAGYYTQVFRPLVGRRFADVAEALEAAHAIQAEMARRDPAFNAVPLVRHVFKTGKWAAASLLLKSK